jgi:acyl-CoA synthetase (NDP forming)
VAVVGASADPSKWGNALAHGALRGAHRRPVCLVNRTGGKILGQPAYRSLAELPEAVELVVVSVPAAAFEEAVDDALAAGAKAIVGISAGLGEHDQEGRDIEARVAQRVREAGAVLLGPNCLGVFDAEEELDLGWSALPKGRIALVSQSGNLALELARFAAAADRGFSRFASLGNQADLVAADLLEDLALHEPTRVIALYLEDFRDGRAFVEAAAAAAREKPVLLLSGGVSAASAQAALSHTGALVSDARAIEAACHAAGIIRVRTPRQLVDAAQALLPRRRALGPRIAVYADGGGHGVIACDLLAAAGLQVPTLSAERQAVLREQLPANASVANPVDFAGGGERGLLAYADVGRLLLSSREVDAVLLTGYFGGYGADTPELADEEIAAASALAEASAGYDAPLIVHTAYPESSAARELRTGGVPVYGDIEAAVDALTFLRDCAVRRPSLPLTLELAPLAAPEPTYAGARAFVAAAGIRMTEARRVRSLDEALSAADELGYPVALKATNVSHKSDADGVALGLDDAEALRRAYSDLTLGLGREELSVEEMAPVVRGVELVIGSKRDLRFGPIVLVGLGGIYAEVLDDVAVALAPVDEERAERLIRSLRAAPLFAGARGRSTLDVMAAARATAALSRAAAACADIAELEINPLLVLPEGAVGLDARVVLSS